jgi:hypothetical protein
MPPRDLIPLHMPPSAVPEEDQFPGRRRLDA